MSPKDNDTEEKVHLQISNGTGSTTSRTQATDDMTCGLGPCKPRFMQIFANMGAFTGMYSITAFMSSLFSSYIISQITTIEKQFGLSSSQSGLLLSCNDIGILLTALLFSYFARKIHIPRTLWVCAVLYGIAGILCSLPYFIAKDAIEEQRWQMTEIVSKVQPESLTNKSMATLVSPSGIPVCSNVSIAHRNMNETGPVPDCRDTPAKAEIGSISKFGRIAMGLIAFGMFLQGISKASRVPLLTTYVDDNVKKTKTAMHMGIISGIGIFGPAMAFLLGGVFSRIYVTLEEVSISPLHPAWIGAWWLGFVVFGILSIILAFPLVFFPRRMKPISEREKETSSKQLSLTHRVSIKDFLKSLLRLVSNSVFITQTVADCILIFTVSGMMSFSPKYLETQFFIPAWKANMLLGVITVAAASAGSITGGFVVTKWKLTPLQCIKLNIVTTILFQIQNALGFVFGCDNTSIAGMNTETNVSNNTEACATSCNCDNSTFFPVCGSDNRNYFSPCYAGCLQRSNILFTNCSCISDMKMIATPGLCEDHTCSMLYPFLISSGIGAFLGTISMMPRFIIIIRSTSERDKAMAVGFSTLLANLTGWMAGPIIFGMVVDTACVVWSSSCSGKGACSLYNNDDFRVKKHVFELIPKLVVILLSFFVLYKGLKKTDWSVDSTCRTDGEPETENMNKDATQDICLDER